MKLGFFTSRFPYDDLSSAHRYICGGSITALHSLILELAKKKFAMEIFTTSADGEESCQTQDGLTIHRYATAFRLLGADVSPALFYKPSGLDVDIVTLNFDLPPNPLAGYIYAKKKQVPLVIYYHGDWDSTYGTALRKYSVSLFSSAFVDKMLSYATIIVCPSSDYIDVSDSLSRYRDKIRIIPNGVNPDDLVSPISKRACRDVLKIDTNKKVLLFFGLLWPHKRPELLLKALPGIVKVLPDTLLLFAGDGPMLQELRELAKRLGVEESVRFDGFVTKEKRPLYYKASDVFVLPSKKECFPLVVLESLICETPTIFTEHCGVSDIMKDVDCGYIVQDNNVVDLAKTIICTLENLADGKEKARRGKQYIIDKLTWQRSAEQFENIYLSLTQK